MHALNQQPSANHKAAEPQPVSLPLLRQGDTVYINPDPSKSKFRDKFVLQSTDKEEEYHNNNTNIYDDNKVDEIIPINPPSSVIEEVIDNSPPSSV